MKNPIKWLKEKWKFYCDWYYLDEWIECIFIGLGLALLFVMATGQAWWM
jgi:hypothetical protein